MAAKQQGKTAQQLRDETKNKLQGLGATLTKTDRILTGNGRVHVVFGAPPIPAPSATDGEKIWINPDRIEIESASGLVNLLGLNYHEVCHVLFSPRSDDRTLMAIQAKSMNLAWNILEDMRIETLFSAMYGRAAKFFTAPVVTYIVENQASWDTAYLLTYGRRFLPKAIREEFRSQFKGTDAQRVRGERIIDAYRKVQFPSFVPGRIGANFPDRAIVRLVEEFHELLKELLGDNTDALDSHPQCSGSTRNAGQVDQEAVQMASQRRTEQDAAEEEQDDPEESDVGDDTEQESPEEDDSDDDGSDDGAAGDDAAADVEDETGEDGDPGEGGDEPDEDASGDNEPASGSDDDGAGNGEGDDADQDGSAEWEADSAQGDNADGDHGDGGTVDQPSSSGQRTQDEIAEDVQSAVSDALADVLASEEVQDEITTVMAGMDDSDHVDFEGDRKVGTRIPVRPDMVSASERVEQELRRLREQFEAGWNRGTDHGVLNMSRAIESDYDHETMYDIWEEGNEEDSGLEVVILLDMSVSMEERIENVDGSKNWGNPQRMEGACVALWILKRALDLNDATTSVLGFGTKTVKLFGRDDQVEQGRYEMHAPTFYGTNPTQELKEARRILDASDKPNRLLIVITDGEIHSGNQQDTPEKALAQVDATRMLVQIGKCDGQSEAFLAQCDVTCNVFGSGQLVDLVRDTVTSLLLRKVRG